MHFKYLDLPEVPDHLLYSSLKDFDNLQNIFHLPEYQFYRQYHVTNKDLIAYLDETLKCSYFPSYQVIRNGIAIHKDTGRSEVLNYLIDTGGPNATLNIFNDDLKKIHSEVIKERCWHWIDVSSHHNVTNFSGARIALSIVPMSGSFR